MGSIASQDITISVQPPSRDIFNFHTDCAPAEAQLIAYPSFIKKDHQRIEYSRRSNYPSRQFEISYVHDDLHPTLVFTRLNANREPVWKHLSSNDSIPLFEGCTIRLADTQFEVKKICRSFSEF